MIDKNTISDEELMVLCSKGDKKALEILIERYNKPLLNFFYKLIGNKEDSEDFVQQTFIKIYENAKRYKPISKFTTYIYTIARNMYINEIIRRSKVSFNPIETAKNIVSSIDKPDEIVNKKEVSNIIKEIISSLPLEYKEVLILQVYQGLKCKEIAQILKCPEGTVWSRLHYAYKKFKEEYIKRVGEYDL